MAQTEASTDTRFGSAWIYRAERDYEKWMKSEGIPIHSHIGGFSDVTQLDRGAWARTGSNGCFLEMLGTYQSESGMYVADIPPQKALDPQRHLYPEALVILKGRGSVQLWQREGGPDKTFEWGPGSVFYIPHNTAYRLFNGSNEAVVFMGFTKAPAVFNVLSDAELIFNCDHVFKDMFDLENDTDFYSQNKAVAEGSGGRTRWQTNFIPDVTGFFREPSWKAHSGQTGLFRMGDRWSGHISQWDVGAYHKAHAHGPGAILTAFSGPGYVLIWPRELGIHPYQDGYEDQVVQIPWDMYSVYSPYDQAFHAHFNTGPNPARLLAFYGGGPDTERVHNIGGQVEIPAMISTRKGGTLIEYEDEDPEIRRRFILELEQNGVESTMPPV